MIIDILKYIIDADGAEARGELDRTTKGADTLERKLNDVDSTTTKVNSSFKAMALTAAAAIVSAAALSVSFGSLGSRQNEIHNLANEADRLGESVGNLDAFGRAIQSIGGDANSAISSMAGLSSTVTSMLRGLDTESGKTFGFLGVHLKNTDGSIKSTSALILELSDAVSRMSSSDAYFHLENLGITDTKTIEAMRRGRAELQRLIDAQKAQGVITDAQVESARRFNESLGTIKTMAQAAGNSILDSMLPYIEMAMSSLSGVVTWVRENEDVVTGFFIAVGAAVTLYFLPPMLAAAGAAIAAMLPFLLVAAAVTAIGVAFALAYEDVMAFMNGQDSLIGKIVTKWPMVGKIFSSLVDVFKTVGGSIVDFVMNPIQSVLNLIYFLDRKMIELMQSAKSLVSWIPWVGGDGEDGADGAPSGEVSWRSVDEAIAAGRAQELAANNTTLNTMTSNAISNTANNRSSTLNINDLTIETQATDANGIAGSITSELQSQLQSFDAYTQTVVAG